MNSDVTISVLAGGNRIEGNPTDSLIKIGGKQHIEILTGRLLNNFSNVTVVTDEDMRLKWKNVTVLRDVFSGAGPMAGIHTALEHSSTEKNIIVCISQPFISNEFLKFLAEYENEDNITVTSEFGKIQPFPGIFRKKNLPVVKTILETNEQIPGTSELLQMRNFVTAMDAEIIEVGYRQFYHSKLFLNFNISEDFEALKNYTVN